jgi:hypothetical protein
LIEIEIEIEIEIIHISHSSLLFLIVIQETNAHNHAVQKENECLMAEMKKCDAHLDDIRKNVWFLHSYNISPFDSSTLRLCDECKYDANMIVTTSHMTLILHHHKQLYLEMVKLRENLYERVQHADEFEQGSSTDGFSLLHWRDMFEAQQKLVEESRDLQQQSQDDRLNHLKSFYERKLSSMQSNYESRIVCATHIMT